MIYLIFPAIALMIVMSLYFIRRRVKRGNKSKAPLVANICTFFGLLLLGSVFCILQAPTALAATTTAAATTTTTSDLAKGLGYIAAGLAVGLSGIGGGIAVSASASAALGAISENEKTFGKALIFVGLAEGIALYGLLVAILIIFM